MSSLMATLRASKFGAKASEDEDKEYMEDEEETASEDEPEAEGDEPEAEDEDPEAADDEPEAEDDEPEAEDEEETPVARKAAARARMSERKRILAILTHPNAEVQPALAARMIRNGMAEKSARGILDAVTGAAASTRRPTLAERYAGFNGNRKPGRDGNTAASGKSENRLLATVQAARATRKKGA